MSVHEARVYGMAEVAIHVGIIFFPQNKSLNNFEFDVCVTVRH